MISAWSIWFSVPTLTSPFAAHQVPLQRRVTRAATSRHRNLTWTAEPRKGPKGQKVKQHAPRWAILLSQSRFLNEMDLILERQADVFGSHPPPASVSQPPSDANSPPPCKTQRVKGETSSCSKWIITGNVRASFMAFLSKVRWFGWILAPCLPLCQVNEQLFIKNNPFINVENDIRKGRVDQ